MIRTQDGFTNFEASLGFGADNLSSHARYTLNPQSRNGQQLATAYRGSWIVGGAIAVMLIEGQDFREPLRIDRMGRNQLKGLRVLDRWMVQPSLHERVTAY